MAAGDHHYIIVGAGSAGCVLAGRLSADPACRVVLLEAGGSDRKREIRIPAAFTKLLRTGYDWNYRTSKQPQLSDRELYWPRGKTLGGSSSINGQIWTRGHRVDYDGWAQSCPGWSYEEVLPYFQRAEHRVGSNAGGVYGSSGPQACGQLGRGGTCMIVVPLRRLRPNLTRSACCSDPTLKARRRSRLGRWPLVRAAPTKRHGRCLCRQ
jgi:choline dehydrogenase